MNGRYISGMPCHHQPTMSRGVQRPRASCAHGPASPLGTLPLLWLNQTYLCDNFFMRSWGLHSFRCFLILNVITCCSDICSFVPNNVSHCVLTRFYLLRHMDLSGHFHRVVLMCFRHMTLSKFLLYRTVWLLTKIVPITLRLCTDLCFRYVTFPIVDT